MYFSNRDSEALLRLRSRSVPKGSMVRKQQSADRASAAFWSDRTPQIKCKVSLLRSWSKIGVYQSRSLLDALHG
ncbi:hypothetical protein [Allocoleopsis sp.]|uniref:hypothetical protein n=1 Tax=Allocoleopsis sp. TaxID=3088169 RepID=UPI002FD6D06F